MSYNNSIELFYLTIGNRNDLDMLDELLSIFSGITREQILRKPIDKNLFGITIKNMFK
jgi:hypothetical protein